jgi:hypothetical protein
VSLSVFFSQQQIWRIRTNQELQEMQKHLDIIANTKKKKIRVDKA